jgi:hypothetical protein
LLAGLEFLGCIGPETRRRLIIVALRVYLDDSGTTGDGPILCIAGFMLPHSAWEGFEPRWKTVLAAPRSIPYFKMRHAVSRDGVFQGFTLDDIDKKVRALAEVVNEQRPEAIWFTVDLSLFSDDRMRTRPYPMNQAYFWAAHLIISNIGNHLYHRGLRERFELVFDYHPKFSRDLQDYYPVICSWMEPEVREIMPLFVECLDDQQAVPLQAADFFAWLGRRLVAGDLNPFPWIREAWPQVRQSPMWYEVSREEIERALARNETEAVTAERQQLERRIQFRRRMGLTPHLPETARAAGASAGPLPSTPDASAPPPSPGSDESPSPSGSV